MRGLIPLRLIPLLSLVAAIAGCVQPASIVRDRHAAEYHCPSSNVSVSDLGGGAYMAVGCGPSTSYICVGNHCAANVIHGRGGPRPVNEAVATQVRHAAHQRRVEMAAVLAPASDAVLQCFPGAQRVEVRLSVNAQGRVYEAYGPRILSPTERQCLRRAFEGHHAPRARMGVSVAMSFPVAPVVAPTRPSATATSTPTTAVAATTTPGASTRTDDTARLRTWLDGQRDAILTCTERANVAVTARWDATGTVTIALAGDLAGTPAEGCVRSALGAQRVAAGTAGELRHLVR